MLQTPPREVDQTSKIQHTTSSLSLCLADTFALGNTHHHPLDDEYAILLSIPRLRHVDDLKVEVAKQLQSQRQSHQSHNHAGGNVPQI